MHSSTVCMVMVDVLLSFTAGEPSLIAEEEVMFHPETEGRSEEPLLQQDDLINRIDELSDGDEVMHSTHSIMHLSHEISYKHLSELCGCLCCFSDERSSHLYTPFLFFQTPNITTLLDSQRVYFNYDCFTDGPIPESLQVQCVRDMESHPLSTHMRAQTRVHTHKAYRSASSL